MGEASAPRKASVPPAPACRARVEVARAAGRRRRTLAEVFLRLRGLAGDVDFNRDPSRGGENGLSRSLFARFDCQRILAQEARKAWEVNRMPIFTRALRLLLAGFSRSLNSGRSAKPIPAKFLHEAVHEEFAIVSTGRGLRRSTTGGRIRCPDSSAKAYVPPVLREAGAASTAIFTLPVPPKIPDGPPPVLRHADPEYPGEFVRDSVAYLESQLDRWQQSDAVRLLGVSLPLRPSVDEEGKARPAPLLPQFELDFEGESAAHHLRLPGKYELARLPPRLWMGCFQTDTGSGRSFYSYLNCRLDVLVDATGNVIGLGIY